MSHVATGGVLASQPSNCGRLANTNCPQQNQGRHSVVTPPLALRLPVLWASTPRPPTTLPCGLRPPRLRRVIQKGQFSRLLCGGYQPRRLECQCHSLFIYLFFFFLCLCHPMGFACASSRRGGAAFPCSFHVRTISRVCMDGYLRNPRSDRSRRYPGEQSERTASGRNLLLW